MVRISNGLYSATSLVSVSAVTRRQPSPLWLYSIRTWSEDGLKFNPDGGSNPDRQIDSPTLLPLPYALGVQNSAYQMSTFKTKVKLVWIDDVHVFQQIGFLNIMLSVIIQRSICNRNSKSGYQVVFQTTPKMPRSLQNSNATPFQHCEKKQGVKIQFEFWKSTLS